MLSSVLAGVAIAVAAQWACSLETAGMLQSSQSACQQLVLAGHVVHHVMVWSVHEM